MSMISTIEKLPFPLVNSPFYKTLIDNTQLSPKEQAYVEHYRKYGYVIIEDCVADELTARRIHTDCEAIKAGYGDNRIQDAWSKSDAVKSVATNELVLSIIRTLYGREPIPVQTLNFLKGTQQRTHSDVIHFSSLPSGFMCGVWTALEDITLTQGPLHFYPESQNLPEFDYYDLGISEECVYPDDPHAGDQTWDNPRTREKYTLYEDVVERLMNEHGFERKHLTLKRGQSLIWSSNLFHGGSPITDPTSTRKSQVTHIHFDGTIPWTPMYSNALIGDYYMQGISDIRTGKPFDRTYNFMPVNMIPMSKPSRYKIGLKTNSDTRDMQLFMPQEYTLELEYARKENAELRKTLEEITQTQLWKTMQPIRKLAHRMRSKSK
jgi:hypothetical protein